MKNDKIKNATSETVESLGRREMIRKIAKAGTVVPIAVVIYNASTTVAAAEE